LKLTVVDRTGNSHDLLIAADTTSAQENFYGMRPGLTRPIGMFFKPSYDRLTARYTDLLPKDTTGT